MTFQDDSDGNAVQLLLTGPVELIDGTSLVASAPLSMTWLEFLTTVCALDVNENSELYVCTAKFSPHVADVGFTAGLNDVIGDFIEKFSKKRSRYRARLHRGTQPGKNVKCTSNSEPISPDIVTLPIAKWNRVRRDSVKSVGSFFNKIGNSTPKKSSVPTLIKPPEINTRCSLRVLKRVKRKARSCSPVKDSILNEPLPVSVPEPMTIDEDQFVPLSPCIVRFDEGSFPTSFMTVGGGRMTLEPYERDGETMTEGEPMNMLQQATFRLGTRYDDSFLACIHKELIDLERRGVWSRIMQRSPLFSNLVESLFK